MNKAGISTAAEFRELIGTDNHPITLMMKNAGPCPASNADCTSTDSKGNSTITLINLDQRRALDSNGSLHIQETFIHELAHAWDKNFNGELSAGLERRTGYYYNVDERREAREPGDGTPVSEYGKTSRQEDWAESVAAVVFADNPQARIDRFASYYNPNSARTRYVLEQLTLEHDSRPPGY